MAVRDKLIIGTDALTELSYIDTNVDEQLLVISIIRSQDNHIEPILGTPLFKKILSDINSDSLTGTYETLVDEYIVKYLTCMVEMTVIPHINWEIRNKAVGSSSDDTITATDERGAFGLIELIRKEAATYKRRLLGYLCDEYEDGNLPEYGQGLVDKEEIAPNKEEGNTANIKFL